MYNVVFENIGKGTHTGVISWSSFSSKAEFDQWYDEKMRNLYWVVEGGVSDERAIEICSRLSSENAVVQAWLREMNEAMETVSALLS